MVLETNVGNMKTPSILYNTPLKAKRIQSNKQKIKTLVKSEHESKNEYIPKNFTELKTIKLKQYGVEFMVAYVNEGMTKAAYCKKKKISPKTLNTALSLNGVDYYVHKDTNEQIKQNGIQRRREEQNKPERATGESSETGESNGTDGTDGTDGTEKKKPGRPRKVRQINTLIAGTQALELDDSHNLFKYNE